VLEEDKQLGWGQSSGSRKVRNRSCEQGWQYVTVQYTSTVRYVRILSQRYGT